MSNPRGWLADPAARHARAVKAGQAARRTYLRRARERAKGLSPAEAWTQGYRTGYQRAYCYWRQWAERVRKREAA
jgi:hypothetical protein